MNPVTGAIVRQKSKRVILVVFALGYLAIDCWLYEFSGLSIWDAILLDVPITVIFFLLGAGVYWLASQGDGAADT